MREGTMGRRRAALVMGTCVAMALAGCDMRDPGDATRTGDVAAASAADAGQALVASVGRLRRQQLEDAPMATTDARLRMPTLVAAAPDRGELARIAPAARPTTEGAWRWHRVDVSEAHALASLASGSMVLQTPSGERLTLDYAGHEEHAGGDWTWIGSVRGVAAGLDSAVVTFGARALFARIPQPGGKPPLAMMMRDGAVWLGETSWEALARWRPARSRDFAVPGVDGPQVEDASAMSLARDALARGTPGQATVDLIIGYSRSFRMLHGGTSQAVTRTNHLVALANRALETSRVDGRLRLLHATEVDYPDATSNEVALYELTGVNGYDVPRSLAQLHGPLRQAYGADLVALLRPFRLATSESCGNGWLLGQDGAQITPAWAIYGFSVSSDGFDQGWGCEDLTLAHELGHNMGLAHDRANSTDVGGTLWYGAYPWAFGYKTREPDGIGFADVMAYPDYGQPSVLAYSSPQLTHMGIPFGTPDDDAARALRLTMPAVARLLGTRVPDEHGAPHDVDGDGTSDVLVHDPGARTLALWRMQGQDVVAVPPQAHAAGLSPVATGDLDGDGRTDVLWRDGAGGLHLWSAWNDAWQEAAVGGPALPASTTILGAADFTGEGRDQLLLLDTAAQSIGYASVEVSGLVDRVQASLPPGATLAGSGDLDGDGRHDLLWLTGTRELVVWWSNAAFGEASATLAGGPLPQGWVLSGVGDVTGDGHADLVFFHDVRAQMMWWQMEGGEALARSAPRQTMRGTRLDAVGDFDGDGRTDALVRTRARELRVWTGDGNTLPFATQPIRRLSTATSRVLRPGVRG